MRFRILYVFLDAGYNDDGSRKSTGSMKVKNNFVTLMT